MNSTSTQNIVRFIALVLLQVIVLNNINFLGYINPYVYILFILLYPIDNNRLLFIFLGFLLGLTVDMFSDSGGVHAAATVVIAYVRPIILKSTFGMMYEHQTVKISNSELGQRITYIALVAFVHHLVLFVLVLTISSHFSL